MRYTVTVSESHMSSLRDAIFSRPGLEGAAYMVCGMSVTAEETRFLVRNVVPVRDEEYLVREPLRLSIDSRSYARVAKQALADGASVFFVHSHPEGIADFSPQDNREEPKLMAFLAARLGGRPCGSFVFSGAAEFRGRVWDGSAWAPIERLRVLGKRFRFHDLGGQSPEPWFDRQVAAFGPELQALLSRLHIGVVGCSGTGSAVAEQLCRLGVGMLSLFDGDSLEKSNVTRVYGSRVSAAGKNKAAVLGEHLQSIGLGTKVAVHEAYISAEEVAKELRRCDLVFGCTDLEAPRALLANLALRYLIPVFDLGVKITSKDGTITDISGRVTTLFPGHACLFCRERITPARIAFEGLTPEEQVARVKEGYAPELTQRDPAVIMFTTAVAAQAVSELLHRLSGFMGAERASTEVLLRFHANHFGKNAQPPAPDCLCAQQEHWGWGDTRPFLDVTWNR